MKNSKSEKPAVQKGAIRLVMRYMHRYMPLIVVALIFSAVQITATLFAPVVVGKAIDYILGENNVNFEKIMFYAFILMGLIAAVMIFQWLASLCTNKAAMNTVRDLRCAAFNKLNRVPLSYVDTKSHGDLLSRVVNDTDLISDGLIQGFTQLFTGVVTIIGTIIFMIQRNVTVTLVVVLITPVSICVAYFIARATHNMFRRQQTMRGTLSGLSEEALSGVKVIKAFNREKQAEKEFDEVNEELRKVGIKAMFYSALTNPGTRFVNGIVYAAVAVVGALMVIDGGDSAFTVGMLSCFLSYANQYTKPFNEITLKGDYGVCICSDRTSNRVRRRRQSKRTAGRKRGTVRRRIAGPDLLRRQSRNRAGGFCLRPLPPADTRLKLIRAAG